MSLTRYAIAGGVSLIAHAALLFVAQEPKALAMPAGSQSTSVAINFVAAPPPSPASDAIPTEAPETVQAAAELTSPTKSVATKPAVKKHITKPIKSKPAQVKSAKPATKQQPKIPEQKAPPTPPIDNVKPQPATQGASSEPVMVQKPSFVTRPVAPHYPRLAQKRGIEGVTMYEVWLDENGNQVKQVLIASSGETLLDKSALNAIKQWRFSPHIIAGQKVAHRVQIPVRFKLD